LTNNTALRAAISHGHANCVDLLLENEANLNIVGSPYLDMTYSSDGVAFFAPHTALVGAIRQFNDTIIPRLSRETIETYMTSRQDHRDRWFEIIRRMVDLGVDVNRPGCHTESSALVEACENKDTRVLEYLLQNGAYVNQRTHVALRKEPLINNAVTLAAFLGNHKTLQILIQFGGDTKTCTEELLEYMIDNRYWSSAYLVLISGMHISQRTRSSLLNVATCETDASELCQIQEFIRSPLKLAFQCRTCIRGSFSPNKSRLIISRQLDLMPKPLLKFITYES